MSDVGRVEAAARVLHDLDNAGNGLTWDQADRLYQAEYHRRARVVLTAADTADAQSGWLRCDLNTVDIERLCEEMHDAYERAAAVTGWETQDRSRKPWARVPEANKTTMRIAVKRLLDVLYLDQRAAGAGTPGAEGDANG